MPACRQDRAITRMPGQLPSSFCSLPPIQPPTIVGRSGRPEGSLVGTIRNRSPAWPTTSRREDLPMATEKRIIDNREFWFTTEPVYKEHPDTGEFTPTGQYYCLLDEKAGADDSGQRCSKTSAAERDFSRPPKRPSRQGSRKLNPGFACLPRHTPSGFPAGTQTESSLLSQTFSRKRGSSPKEAAGWRIHLRASGCTSGMTAARPSSSRSGYVN